MNIRTKKTVAHILLLFALLLPVASCNSSRESEKRKELKMELEAKEGMLSQMEAFIEKARAAPLPGCALGPATLTIDETQINELRSEVETLRKEIDEMN